MNKKSHDTLYFTPFGGVAEIGSNMSLFETKTSKIVIDCGILFPREDVFGINYLIPNFNALLDDPPQAIIITHGHEDHIGAIVHFVKKFPHIPIYATPFAAALIMAKLERQRLRVKIYKVDLNEEYKIGDISIQYIHVNHSIPQTCGILISHSQTSLFYASDFKVDHIASKEDAIDLENINRLMAPYKRRVGLIDSTNILGPGKTRSETDLEAGISTLLAKDNHRIFVTLFSSNIHRISTVVENSFKNGRKVILSGQSIEFYIKTAIATGVIDDFTYYTEKDAKKIKSKSTVIISGCQGDFFSSLRRLSAGEHSQFKLNEDDIVAFSSKVIPGNARKVYKMYNDITDKGAKVVTDNDFAIHASGHPSQQDLIDVYQNINFTDVVPIHGESYFLEKHKEFIKENFKKLNSVTIRNFSSILFNSKEIKIIDPLYPFEEPVLIQKDLSEIERSDISMRRKIAEGGVVFITTEKNKVQTIDFAGIQLSNTHEIIKKINNRIAIYTKEKKFSQDEVSKITTRQILKDYLGYKPVTVEHVIN